MNAVWVWGVARAFGGSVLLRVEDHDRGRSRPEFEAAMLDDLDWLGLVPDGMRTDSFRRGLAHPQRQSDNEERYAAHLAALEAAALVYPCTCPHATHYPGTCRIRPVSRDATAARRVIMSPDRPETFDDLRLGSQVQDPADQCGDLLVRDRHGGWTYQFAVVVDDFEQGVDVVIRGEDLLDSTGRQLRLARLLGRPEPPRFLHHALVRRADGRKLSKSTRDTGLRDLRAAGHSPAELLGIAAHFGGLQPEATPLPVGALADLLGEWARRRDAR